MEETALSRFVAAWLDVKNPDLDGINPHFQNKYATLKATLEVIREACKKHGLMYQQTLTKDNDGYELASMVIAANGDTYHLSIFPIDVPPNPQSFGSNLTYVKRQQAQADWGITGEEDDDGNAAAEAVKSTNKRSNGNYTRNQQTAPQNEADKRKAWITRALQLKADCITNGVKEASLDAWYAAKFGDVQPVNLTEQQLTEWGKYLSQIAKDSKAMKEGKDESSSN